MLIMARIKIKDLPKDMKITKGELKRISGGAINSFYGPAVLGYKEYNGDFSADSQANLTTLKVIGGPCKFE
jgi:hypothetical protein